MYYFSSSSYFSNGAFLKWSISQIEHFSNVAFLKWSISQMERFSNGAFLKWSNSQMERFSNGAILKWSNSQMERFGVATLCHISRSQEQRNMACDVLPPNIKQYQLILTKYQPVSSYTDPVPSSTAYNSSSRKAQFSFYDSFDESRTVYLV